MSNWKSGAAVVLVAGLLAVWMIGNNSRVQRVNAQVPRFAPIHGYVAAELSPQGAAGEKTNLAARVFPLAINLPDIDVVAKNIRTGAVSNKVTTNPAGYFQTPALAPGEYQICVSGPGYVSGCDPRNVTVLGSTQVLDHVVPIQPTPHALFGTVYLADKVTPCFWFRPAFDTHAVFSARVALVDSGGNVVAGPVKGNSVGQYVLPESAKPGSYTVRATCEKGEGFDAINLGSISQLQNIIIKNNAPRIVSMDLSKGGVGVRRADPGDTLRATVVATDLDGDTLHYRWIDDSGRSLGLPDSPAVDWPLINGRALNTLRVQVSDGKGGFAVAERSLRAGPDEILFAGTVYNRQNRAPVAQAQVSLNNVAVQTNAAGNFQVSVPDAPRFVLNANKIGFALTSRVYYGRNTGLEIPLDPAKKVTVNGSKGGPVTFPQDECAARCKTQLPLSLTFEPGSLVDAEGKPYTGTATVEGFQYDTSLPNPIPGDQGATAQGKTVRLVTFGAFYLQPRDTLGHPLKMAPNKKVKISMPIEPALLAKAPATVPFFTYNEATGMWTDNGTLTRSGGRYIGTITHFSAFNADTLGGGSSCVKLILDPASFTLPVALDAYYVDPANGTFNHNGTQATDNPVGIERMRPNVNFTLEVHDANSNALLTTVTLNSGPALDINQFPDGLVSDPQFNACNGPFTIYNNIPTGPTYLLPITGGSITDNSVTYQASTNANPGGNRNTFTGWLAQNGFPDANDAHAIYFNNGDLKFGRDMHCRVTNAGITACYVSNFGNVGTDDSASALNDARNGVTPVATVAMEYDPNAANGENVQFWAYLGNNSYLPKPTLDGQGGKPMPDLCLACHGGYFDGTKAANAVFLPFDLDSFRYDAQGDPTNAGANHVAVQEQFRRLNALVLATNPDALTGDTTNTPFAHLMNMWYPGGVQNAGQTFTFGTGSAQIGTFGGHTALYDNVVKVGCRTCHITQGNNLDWTSYNQMKTGLFSGSIPTHACGSSSPATHTTYNFSMPHGEVPFKLFWQTNLGATLDSELSFAAGCPNQ
jgi:hypothetical protein